MTARGLAKLVKGVVAPARRELGLDDLRRQPAANDNFELGPLDVADVVLSLGEAAPAALFLFPMWAAVSAYLKDPQYYLNKRPKPCGEPDTGNPIFAPRMTLFKHAPHFPTEVPTLTREDRSQLSRYVQGWDTSEALEAELRVLELNGEGQSARALQLRGRLAEMETPLQGAALEQSFRLQIRNAASDTGLVATASEAAAADAPSPEGTDSPLQDQNNEMTRYHLNQLMDFIKDREVGEVLRDRSGEPEPHRRTRSYFLRQRERLLKIATDAAPQLLARAEHLDHNGAFAIEVYQAYQKLGLLPAEPLRRPLRRLFATLVADVDDPETRKIIYRLLPDPTTPPDLVEDGLARLRTATLAEMNDIALHWDEQRSPVVLGGVEVLAQMQALSGNDAHVIAPELHQLMRLPREEEQKLAVLTYIPLVQSGMLPDADVAEGLQLLLQMTEGTEKLAVESSAWSALMILAPWLRVLPHTVLERLVMHTPSLDPGSVPADVRHSIQAHYIVHQQEVAASADGDADRSAPPPAVWRELWEKYAPADRMRQDRRLRWAATQLRVPVYKLFDPTLDQKLPKRVAWQRYELWAAVADQVKTNDADRTIFLTVLERELMFGKLQDPQTVRHIQFIRERLLGTQIRPYPMGLEFYYLRHLGRLMTDLQQGDLFPKMTWEGVGMMSRDEHRMTPADQLPLHLAYWRRELGSPQPLTIDVPLEMRQKVALRELFHLAEVLPHPATGQPMKTELAAIEALLRNEIDFNLPYSEMHFAAVRTLDYFQRLYLMPRFWTDHEAVVRFRINDLVRRGITQPKGVDATIAVEMLVAKMGTLAGSPQWPADEARAAAHYLEKLLVSSEGELLRYAVLAFYNVAKAAGYTDDEMHGAANHLARSLLNTGLTGLGIDVLTLGVFAVGDFVPWIYPGSDVHQRLNKMASDPNPVLSGMATDLLGEISPPARADAWTFPFATDFHDARGVGVPRDRMGFVSGRSAFANVESSPHLARMSDGRHPMQDPPAEMVPPHEFARIKDGEFAYTQYGRFFRLSQHVGYYKSTVGSAEGFQLNLPLDGNMQAYFLPIAAVRHVISGSSAVTLQGGELDIRLQPKGITDPFFVPTRIDYEVAGMPKLVGHIPWSSAWILNSPGIWHPMLHSWFRDLAPGWDLTTLLNARARRQAGEKLLQRIEPKKDQSDYHIGITVIAALLMHGALETEFASVMVKLFILEGEVGGRVLAHQLAKVAQGKGDQDLQQESFLDEVHSIVTELHIAFPILHDRHLWLWR